MSEISDTTLNILTAISSGLVIGNAIGMLFVYFVGRTLWVGRAAFAVVVQRYERVFVSAFCVFGVIAEAAITHGWRVLDGAGACEPPSTWLLSWITINGLSAIGLLLACFSRRYMRYFLHIPVLLQTPGWLLYITSTASSSGECGVAIIALFPLCAGAFLMFFVPQAFLINFDKVEAILTNKTSRTHGEVEMTRIPDTFRGEGQVGGARDFSYFDEGATASDVERILNPISLESGMSQNGAYLKAHDSGSESSDDAPLRRRKNDDSEYETKQFHRALNEEEKEKAAKKRNKRWGKSTYDSDSRRGDGTQ